MQNQVKPKEVFNIKYNLTNITDEVRPTTFFKGDEITVNLTAINEYAIDYNSISILLNEIDITDSCEITIGNTNEEGQILDCIITIYQEQTQLIESGNNITITASATEIEEDLVFPIEYSLINITNNNITSFRAGDTINIILKANDGYQINSNTLTVTLGANVIDNTSIITNEKYNEKNQLIEYDLTIDESITNSVQEGESLIISAEAQEIADEQYEITYNLENIITPSLESIAAGTALEVILSANEDCAIQPDSIQITINEQIYENYTTEILNTSENGVTELKVNITAADVIGNINITASAQLYYYYNITINKIGNNDYRSWTKTSTIIPITESDTQDIYRVKEGNSFDVSYQFNTTVDGEYANAMNYQINGEYQSWVVNDQTYTMSIEAVTHDVEATLSYGQKVQKVISFENLNNAKFIVNTELSQPQTSEELKEYYVSGDSIVVWQNSPFGGYVWPINETDTTESILDNYNYTASAYINNSENLFSGNTINLPWEAEPEETKGVYDDVTINASFMSKDISPVQIVFNDQTFVDANVNIDGSVQTLVNNTQTSNASFAKSNYELYLDAVEPALEKTSDFDTITTDEVSGTPGVDSVQITLKITSEEVSTDAKYKITQVEYSNDAGTSWTTIAGDSTEKFILTGESINQTYSGLNTTYVTNQTIVKIHVSILQQDSVTLTFNCSDNAYVTYNGSNRSSLTLNVAYGTTVSNIPLAFDEYYTLNDVTSPQGTPAIEQYAGINYIIIGTVTTDLQFDITAKEHYWTVTTDVNEEAYVFVNENGEETSNPNNKITKGNTLITYVKYVADYRYVENSGVTISVGGVTNNDLMTLYNQTDNIYSITIPTTTESGDIIISLKPTLRDQIPITFNLANSTATWSFEDNMSSDYFVTIGDKTRVIENGEVIYLYSGALISGKASMLEEFAADAYNRRWTECNITQNSDGTQITLPGVSLPSVGTESISINQIDYAEQTPLTNIAGYTINVMHTVNYSSKIMYSIVNNTDSEYNVYLNGGNLFAETSESGSAGTLNNICPVVSLNNTSGSQITWYCRPATGQRITAYDTMDMQTINGETIFNNTEYNSETPDKPGYANWTPKQEGDSIENGITISAWLTLMKDGNVEVSEENSVNDGSVTWGLSYQISNDAGYTWSEVTSSEAYAINDLNTMIMAGIQKPDNYDSIAGLNENNYVDGLMKIIITINPNY